MAEPRVRGGPVARQRAEERTDALVDAFARVLETIDALTPPPTTAELWQRSLGRVLGDRERFARSSFGSERVEPSEESPLSVALDTSFSVW
jgi:hypothetical protein